MKIKKLISLTLAVVLSCSLFTGCATLRGLKKDLGLDKFDDKATESKYEDFENEEYEYDNEGEYVFVDYLNFDHISIPYTAEWEVSTVSNTSGKEQKTLEKRNYIFIPQASSVLSEAGKEINADTSTEEGLEAIYDKFYDMYSSTSGFELTDATGLISFSNKFLYARFDYEGSYDGSVYLVIYPDSNLLVSFNVVTKKSIEKIEEELLMMFNDAIVDSVMSMDGLEDLLERDKYEGNDKYVNTSKKPELEIKGKWLMDSDSKMCYVFEKNNKVYLYEDINDKNDNYMKGKAKIYDDFDEIVEEFGINPDFKNTVERQGLSDNYALYGVKIAWEEIVQDGVELEQKDATTTMVWVVIDNGSEGIEAQVLRISDYSAFYFTKIK